MILFTGLAFFSFIVFDDSMGLQIAAFLGTGPLAMVVMIGMAQNVLSKATKYSLFDSTKEMSYIPLDDEMKTKGKAAVDVIGGRFGKSGGGIIQSTFFIMLPSYSFVEATPFFAAIFFIVVILWIFAVRGLGKEYNAKIAENEAIAASAK
jgi:AAA family ATP:ADP antiporter